MLAKFLNLKLHPAVILSSVAFWFALYLGIYIFLVCYFIHKMTTDPNIRVDEGATAYILVRANGKIYRCKIKKYTEKIVVR